MICVYFHINPLKNEVFYVGIGNLKRPFSKLGRSKYWYRTVSKYGYIVDVIHTNLTWEEACKLEIFYIKWFGRKDLHLGTLCNLTNGGDGKSGMLVTSLTREKQSNSHKGRSFSIESRLKISNSNKGKLRKLETRIKNSIASKNRSVEHKNKIYIHIRKPVLQFDLNDNFIKEWISATDVQNILKIKKQSICRCCKNKVKSAGGFKWKYKL